MVVAQLIKLLQISNFTVKCWIHLDGGHHPLEKAGYHQANVGLKELKKMSNDFQTGSNDWTNMS
jgi:hypothetical protein